MYLCKETLNLYGNFFFLGFLLPSEAGYRQAIVIFFLEWEYYEMNDHWKWPQRIKRKTMSIAGTVEVGIFTQIF